MQNMCSTCAFTFQSYLKSKILGVLHLSFKNGEVGHMDLYFEGMVGGTRFNKTELID